MAIAVRGTVVAIACALAMSGARSASAFDWAGRDCSHWQGPQRAECLASQKADADAHAATPTPGARQAQQGQAKVEVRPHGPGGEAATYDVRVQEGQQPGGAP